MKNILLILPLLFLSCQKNDKVEPSNQTPSEPERIERFVTVSNGLVMPDAWTTQDMYGYSSYSGYKGDLIYIRVDGCGIPVTNWQTGVTSPSGGPATCQANLNISGVGNRIVTKSYLGGNPSFIIP